MKSIFIVAGVVLLSGCAAIRYDANQVKYFGESDRTIKAAVSTGEVRYLPASGIGQRSVSISGGLLLLFSDISRDLDVAIDKMSRTEIERSIKANTAPSSTEAVCLLNADVLYLKTSKMGTQTTEIRYTLVTSGKELHSGKVKTKLPYPFEFSLQPKGPSSEIDMITSGIHQNVKEYMNQSAVRSVLNSDCSA